MFNLSGDAAAAIIGGVVGSAVSGIIALVLQQSANRDTSRREKEREADADRASLQTIFIALQECAASSTNYRKAIDAAAKKANGRPLWQALRGFAGPHDRVELLPSDLRVLFKLGLGELFNDVRDTITSHNGAHEAWKAYSLLRSEFGRTVPAQMHGSQGISELGNEELGRVGPLVAQIDSIATELQARAEGEEALARRALEGVVDALERFAGVRFEIRWEGQRASLMAQDQGPSL